MSQSTSEEMAGQSDPELSLFSAAEMEFLAEDEIIDIVPNMRMEPLHLISVLPVEVTQLPLFEKLYLNSNRLTVLPPELGQLKNLKVLRVDDNMLISVPVELRQCVGLMELSLEHNKLVRPLLDFRAMAELRGLRLFGNPLEFLPEILPLQKLRHLSLANMRIVFDENLRSVIVQIEGMWTLTCRIHGEVIFYM